MMQQQTPVHKTDVTEVRVSSDMFRSGLYHSYLTQSEEIAGLLVGFKEYEIDGSLNVYCVAAVIN